MPELVLTLSYEDCILAYLLWCESTLMRKTYLILPLTTLTAPVTKSQTWAESKEGNKEMNWNMITASQEVSIS